MEKIGDGDGLLRVRTHGHSVLGELIAQKAVQHDVKIECTRRAVHHRDGAGVLLIFDVEWCN